jgi:hypothetical protein
MNKKISNPSISLETAGMILEAEAAFKEFMCSIQLFVKFNFKTVKNEITEWLRPSGRRSNTEDN